MSVKFQALRWENVTNLSLVSGASYITGSAHKRGVQLFVQNIKECMGELKSLNIVNLYRGMSKLKLKITVNIPQFFVPCRF